MKKIIFGVAILMAAVTAQANYLYWQLADSITMQNTGATYVFDGSDDSAAATVYVVDANGKKTAGTIGKIGADGQFASLDTTEISSAGTYLVDIGDLYGSAYSYYVEYVGFDTSYGYTTVGSGSTTPYADLSGSIAGYQNTELTPISQVSIWHGGTPNAPEPTSAVLMLLGVAGLALKRKQRKLNEV